MKIKKIITIVFIVLAVGMAAFSGIMKLIGGPEITEGMAKFGISDKVILLGLMEIVFAILFIFKPTFKLGFILLSCYFAGALATEMSHGMPLNAFTPLILVWIATFLRDSSVFLPAKADAAKLA